MCKRTFFGLICAAVLLLPVQTRAEPQLVANLSLSADVEGFGGFSGLEVSSDGERFTAISDKGRIMRGRIVRNSEGNPSGVADMEFAYLLDTDGGQMPHWRADAEGLAIDSRGRLFVSFEGDTPRVWRYDQFGGAATSLPKGAFFDGLQGNSGLEGLAIDQSGTLYTSPERSGRETRPFPVWRLQNNRWTEAFSVPRKPPHLMVGMDIGPDGKLYTLERAFSGLSFRTRIRRFDITGNGLQNEESVLDTTSGTHMNLEGLSVWKDGDGVLRITLIADDNFRSFLSTDLVEYRFPNLP